MRGVKLMMLAEPGMLGIGGDVRLKELGHGRKRLTNSGDGLLIRQPADSGLIFLRPSSQPHPLPPLEQSFRRQPKNPLLEIQSGSFASQILKTKQHVMTLVCALYCHCASSEPALSSDRLLSYRSFAP